jgi:transposase InsO family protein
MVTVEGLCALAGCSRQAYYKQRRCRSREWVDEQAILELVKRERCIQPKLGARKLLVLLSPELEEMGIFIGRDRFLVLLAEQELLVVRKCRTVQTTNSRHGFRMWPNRIRFIIVSMIHQVWLSDLTYVRTEEGFMYLCLVMDAYSHKIVGYDISDSLEADGCLRSLRLALEQLPPGARPIHHSDRGTQYCCNQYIAALERRGCPISMTEANHCYENATAERLNGILKDEYGLSYTFQSKAQAKMAAHQAVALYNCRRPHTSLQYRTPAAVHADCAA